MKIAVVGASGFVGSTLVERLWSGGRAEVKPLIHSSGNAWRLARHAKPLYSVDLLSKDDLVAVLDGCTHVVNCSRGDSDTMIRGLANLLEHHTRRFLGQQAHVGFELGVGDQVVIIADVEAEVLPRRSHLRLSRRYEQCYCCCECCR